ncbi:unnamed protein product [Mucor fragilis]
MDESVSYHFATVKQRRENRHEIDYQLTLRQQPKQSRMCGVGEKADRRPIDPPPIVQLKVIDAKLPLAEKNAYLQNPYYFMYASLMAADLDEELHLLRDGKTRSTTGSVVSSLYHLKDIDNTDAGFFVFPDLSVRMEGSYRLKLSLFEIIGKEVFHCRSIISNKFFVYSAKKFPGMEESTFLSRSFADQGLKIRIRKELRQRRKLSKISDIEDKDNSSVTPSPTSTANSKKAKVHRGASDGSPPMLGAMSSSNSNMTTSTASTTTPTLPTAAVNSHYRVDLPPNPTRYISYSSKQQPDAWSASPQSLSPVGASTNRCYAQEEGSNTSVDCVQPQPSSYFVHSDPYHSHSQASLKYPLSSHPPPPSSSSSSSSQHKQQPMSFGSHSGSRMNPPLFYYPSNYSSSSLPPPPSQSISTQQQQQHSQQPSQHLPPPP